MRCPPLSWSWLAALSSSLLLTATEILCAPQGDGAGVPDQVGIRLKGLHAYPGKESVAAGDSISFHLSSEIPYRLRVTRLGPEVDDRSKDVTVFASPETFAPAVQPIHPGSWIKVAKGLAATARLEQLTLECWVRPWSLSRWQGILTQHDYPEHCGCGLFLDGSGRVRLKLSGYHSTEMLEAAIDELLAEEASAS